LPLSGKTTFIAALWHVLESQEIESSFQITALPKDREYLNAIRDFWLDCKSVERTPTGSVRKVVLNITSSASKNSVDFLFPDVSGEMYFSQFESRQLTVEYLNMLKSANGIIVFINPDHIKQPFLISDALPVIGTSNSNGNEPTTKPWAHADAPTQVVLVDLLQMISSYIESPFKISIVVSAWDVILESHDMDYQKLKPIEWVEKELPLLFQFLKSNENSFDSIVFGISAQGSKYNADNSELQKFGKQSERIKIQLGDEITSDITHPIRWLLNEGQ
jgi:hypothetical protein